MCKCSSQHFDVVGSFLRPDRLKQARSDYENKQITESELEAIEDETIRELIDKQIACGLDKVTDGEFRRALWHLDFFWGLQGVERVILDQGYRFEGLETRGDSIRLSGRISSQAHPFLKHYQFVADYVGDRAHAKQTIPAPAQLAVELYRSENAAATSAQYPDKAVLYEDIKQAYVDFIQQLYEAGCRYLQLDDCTWGIFLQKENAEKAGIPEDQIEIIMEEYLALNNSVLDALPQDLHVSTHVCRGNYHSHHAFSGDYGTVAPILFQKENVDSYYLEYDDIRSGNFEPLCEVSQDKHVVLGLITSKNGDLEDKETIIRRIREASRYVPLSRLSLSPQCGFASTEEGNKVSDAQQWAKIKLVREIAEEVWQ